MTRIKIMETRCAVCGTVSKHPILLSTNAFGSPDLDARPPGMQRRTMHTWIQECPACGYVSRNIMKKPEHEVAEYLKSSDYRKCDGLRFKSDLAKKFYKRYKLEMFYKRTEDAYTALLHASWVCDDYRDVKGAKVCRKLAVPLLSRLISDRKKKNENVDVLYLIRADLLRRTDQFDKLKQEYKKVSFSEELYNEILQFQLQKAEERDHSCYTIAAAEMNGRI